MRAARRLRSIDLCHAAVRAFERGVHASVHDAIAAFDEAAAARDARIGEPARVACAGDRSGFTAAGDGEQREIDRVHANANGLIDREFRERAPNQVCHRLGVECDLARDDLPRHDDRECGDVLFEDRRGDRRDVGELRGHRVDDTQRIGDARVARGARFRFAVDEAARVAFVDQTCAFVGRDLRRQRTGCAADRPGERVRVARECELGRETTRLRPTPEPQVSRARWRGWSP